MNLEVIELHFRDYQIKRADIRLQNEEIPAHFLTVSVRPVSLCDLDDPRQRLPVFLRQLS